MFSDGPVWNGSDTEVWVGTKNVMLTCAVCSNPSPNLMHTTWKFIRNGTTQSELPEDIVVLHNGTLQIKEAMLNHTGSYMCSVGTPVVWFSTDLSVMPIIMIVLNRGSQAIGRCSETNMVINMYSNDLPI